MALRKLGWDVLVVWECETVNSRTLTLQRPVGRRIFSAGASRSSLPSSTRQPCPSVLRLGRGQRRLQFERRVHQPLGDGRADRRAGNAPTPATATRARRMCVRRYHIPVHRRLPLVRASRSHLRLGQRQGRPSRSSVPGTASSPPGEGRRAASARPRAWRRLGSGPRSICSSCARACSTGPMDRAGRAGVRGSAGRPPPDYPPADSTVTFPVQQAVRRGASDACAEPENLDCRTCCVTYRPAGNDANKYRETTDDSTGQNLDPRVFDLAQLHHVSTIFSAILGRLHPTRCLR